MADIVPEIARQNSATSALRRLADESRARIAPASPAPAITTLPDGRVLDSSGKVVYTPTPRNGGTP